MTRTIEERRAQHVEYMRRYREKNQEKLKPIRRALGQRYWRENKEKVTAKRKATPRTDKDRLRWRTYQKKWRQKNPAKIKELYRKRYARDPQYARRYWLKRLEVQAGRPKPKSCDICGETKLRIAFDHCHKTGVFRGWICNHCNVVLGYVKDDTEHLRKLISYLEQSRNQVSPQLTLPL